MGLYLTQKLEKRQKNTKTYIKTYILYTQLSI